MWKLRVQFVDHAQPNAKGTKVLVSQHVWQALRSQPTLLLIQHQAQAGKRAPLRVRRMDDAPCEQWDAVLYYVHSRIWLRL